MWKEKNHAARCRPEYNSGFRVVTKIEFDSATLPPAEPDPPHVLDLSLAEQKCGLIELIQPIAQAYAVRIARGVTTQQEMNKQLSVLLTAIETLDRADNGEDIRRSYPSRKPRPEDFAPRAKPKKSPEEIKALSAPASVKRSAPDPRPFDDELPENLRIPEPHDLL